MVGQFPQGLRGPDFIAFWLNEEINDFPYQTSVHPTQLTLSELQETWAASQDITEFMQVHWENETRSTNTPIKTGSFKTRSCK